MFLYQLNGSLKKIKVVHTTSIWKYEPANAALSSKQNQENNLAVSQGARAAFSQQCLEIRMK